MKEELNILIVGATGKVGRCLTAAGLERGRRLSVFVRNPAKLKALIGAENYNKLAVFRGDALNQVDVEPAVKACSAVVNAAVNRGDRRIFEAVCRSVINIAERELRGTRLFWQFGGLPGLDVPHTQIMGTDLPGMPDLFKSHKTNYNLLRKTTLNWTFICPGPMYFADHPVSTNLLRISENVMPYSIKTWTKRLPKIAHPFIMRSRLAELAVAYEDVAAFIMENIDNPIYKNKRIGIAYK